MSSISIPRWFDRHLHIRDGDMMKLVLPCTVNQRATGAIIMPNLADPITTIEKAESYLVRIMELLPVGSDFVPCMTLYLTDDTDPEMVAEGFKRGAWRAVKLYMANQQGKGGTTGSAHGVRHLRSRYKVFEVMEKYQIPLLGHFEAVEEEVDEFDREIVSISRDLDPILKSFPGLSVVFEHITTKHAADFVAAGMHSDNLYATVTAHHLIINRNAMFWGGMSPVHYCKPVPKREKHRDALRYHVTSGNPRFGAGTDSAPHDANSKSRCRGCAAGIFTAPTAVELYATVFDEENSLNHLEGFLSKNLLHLYGMEVSNKYMTIESKTTKIPEMIGNVHVFKGGDELHWQLVG